MNHFPLANRYFLPPISLRLTACPISKVSLPLSMRKGPRTLQNRFRPRIRQAAVIFKSDSDDPGLNLRTSHFEGFSCLSGQDSDMVGGFEALEIERRGAKPLFFPSKSSPRTSKFIHISIMGGVPRTGDSFVCLFVCWNKIRKTILHLLLAGK